MQIDYKAAVGGPTRTTFSATLVIELLADTDFSSLSGIIWLINRRNLLNLEVVPFNVVFWLCRLSLYVQLLEHLLLPYCLPYCLFTVSVVA